MILHKERASKVVSNCSHSVSQYPLYLSCFTSKIQPYIINGLNRIQSLQPTPALLTHLAANNSLNNQFSPDMKTLNWSQMKNEATRWEKKKSAFNEIKTGTKSSAQIEPY